MRLTIGALYLACISVFIWLGYWCSQIGSQSWASLLGLWGTATLVAFGTWFLVRRLAQHESSIDVLPTGWRRRYWWYLIAVDTLVLAWSLSGACIFTSGTHRTLVIPTSLELPLSGVLAVVWLILLSVSGSRHPQVYGVGVDEYRKIVIAMGLWLAAAALIALTLNADLSLFFILLAAGFGVVGTGVARWLLRRWLVARRKQNEQYCSKVVVYGASAQVLDIAREISQSNTFGLALAGIAAPPGCVAAVRDVAHISDDPVQAMRSLGGDTLVLTSGAGQEMVRAAGWQIDAQNESLILADTLVDIAGPRIAFRYVANLTLVTVNQPTFSGISRFMKRTFDALTAALALVILSPLLLAIGLTIRATSPGPALFTQTRVGYQGVPFRIHKFRSMVQGAESVPVMQTGRAGNEVLFKEPDDPRITRVGRLLRRYSLDELPQLFNVLVGNMSLVGPRPPLPEEAIQFDHAINRRFLVKPGITGMWQVNGRSNLSWEESVRFDQYYVENWSFMLDLQILWRTARVVIRGIGAY